MSSFGGGGFGSSGFGTPSNNQGTAFGGFGSSTNTNTGFGTPANNTAGAFGQTSTTPAGGSLFGSGGTNSNTGFGGFGANNNQSSAFGAKPATGFGTPATSTGNSLFGGGGAASNSTFGGGFGSTTTNNAPTGFGSNNTSSSPFGQPAQSTGAFGSGTTTNTGFGPNSSNTGFGSASFTGFGAAANTGFGSANAQNQQNQGTGGTPFQAHQEKDGTSSTISHYQSITFQQPYTNFSFEELRNVDYTLGRRYGNQNGQAGAFGASTGFGGVGNTTGGGFGSTTGTPGSLFGTNTTTNTTGGFGAANANAGFGAPATTGSGLFGQNKPANSPFGATTNAAPAFGSTGTAGFGQGGFGNNTSGSAFGQQNKSLFGPAGSTSSFGTPAASSGFGQSPNNNNSLFQNNNQTNNTAPPFGQPAGQLGAFGSNGFGANNNQTQNQNASSGSLFGSGFGAGNNANQPKPLFGTQSTTPGGLFQNQNQNSQQPNGSTFGSNGINNQQNANAFGKPVGSIFGSTTNNANTGNNLFGSTNNHNQQQTTGNSIFDQPKPGFGVPANTNTGGGLFGTQNNNNNNTTGNSLFGNSQNQNSQSVFGGSLFSNSQQPMQQNQQPQQLTTSIMSNNPYGNDHLFVSLASTPQSVGPLATPLSSSQKNRTPAPLPQYKINPAASSRLITPQKRSGYGFAYSTYGSPNGGSSSLLSTVPYAGGVVSGSIGRPGIGAMGKSLSASNLRNSYNPEDSILNPTAFSPGGLRSFGGPGSLKKLHIDRTLRVDLFGGEATADSAKSSPLKKTVSFEAGKASQDQQNGESSNALVRTEDDSATPSAQEQGYLRTSQKPTDSEDRSSEHDDNQSSSGKEVVLSSQAESKEPKRKEPNGPLRNGEAPSQAEKQSQLKGKTGQYYMTPSQADLHKMSREKLSNVKLFTVERENVGKIVFDQVDLAQVDLDKIFSHIVKLEHRSATVYLDHADKPPQGKGLNVPATITLERSWPRAVGNGENQTRRGPKMDKHIERLRSVPDTEFIKYNIETGQWTFRVEHFSTYACPEDDDDLMNDSGLSPAPETPTLGGRVRHSGTSARSSFFSNGSTTQNSLDDTFEFRRSRVLPGAFEDAAADEEMVTSTSETRQIEEEGNHQYVDDDDNDESMNEPEQAAPQTTLDQPPSTKPKSILKGGRVLSSHMSPARPLVGVDWTEQLQRTLSPKKKDRMTLRQSDGSALRGKSNNTFGQSTFGKEMQPFATTIDVMNSLFGKPAGDRSQWPSTARSQSVSMNASLKAQRDFDEILKPLWSESATLHYSGSRDEAQITLDAFQSSCTPLVRRPDCIGLIYNGPAAPLDSLNSQRSMSSFERVHDVPHVGIGQDVSFAKLASSCDSGSSAGKHEKLMWELAAILFDPIDDAGHSEESARKENLSTFWKKVVQDATSRHRQRVSSGEEAAVILLSGHEIPDAVEALLASKNFRLATLISQLSSTADMREELTNQLKEWRRTNAIAEISAPIRTLYELAAGNTCVSDGRGGLGPENRAETFNISQRFGLDWKRAFGLKLWYGSVGDEPLAETVRAYAADLAAGREEVRPVPWFVEQHVNLGWTDAQAQGRQDVFWGLLCIFAAFSEENEPLSDNDERATNAITPPNTTGNPFDARLAFQLTHLLNARGITKFAPATLDAYTRDLVFQLGSSAATLCPAVHAALHLSAPAARRATVQALLDRHAAAIGDDAATDPATHGVLTATLGVPDAWLWTAKARHAADALHDPARQARCLLRGGDLDAAHAVLITVVAPRAVIAEDLDALRALLADFDAAGGHAAVQGWAAGGAVYAAFAQLMALRDGATADAGDNATAERIVLLRGLASVLPSMDAQGPQGLEARVAAAEMRNVVAEGLVAAERAGGVTVTRGMARFAGDGNAERDATLKEALRLSEAYYARSLVA